MPKKGHDFQATSSSAGSSVTRRSMMKRLGGTALGAWATMGASPSLSAEAKRGVKNDRLKQSIAYWCFQKYWDIEKTCVIAKQMGCKSVELIGPEHWPLLKKHGLVEYMDLNQIIVAARHALDLKLILRKK